jgi:hypothetical protein
VGFLFAERQGFEPWDLLTGVNGFRDRPIRPLWHLSGEGVCLGVSVGRCDLSVQRYEQKIFRQHLLIILNVWHTNEILQ